MYVHVAFSSISGFFFRKKDCDKTAHFFSTIQMRWNMEGLRKYFVIDTLHKDVINCTKHHVEGLYFLLKSFTSPCKSMRKRRRMGERRDNKKVFMYMHSFAHFSMSDTNNHNVWMFFNYLSSIRSEALV